MTKNSIGVNNPHKIVKLDSQLTLSQKIILITC